MPRRRTLPGTQSERYSELRRVSACMHRLGTAASAAPPRLQRPLLTTPASCVMRCARGIRAAYMCGALREGCAQHACGDAMRHAARMQTRDAGITNESVANTGMVAGATRGAETEQRAGSCMRQHQCREKQRTAALPCS
jgi:hypothetical protein